MASLNSQKTRRTFSAEASRAAVRRMVVLLPLTAAACDTQSFVNMTGTQAFQQITGLPALPGARTELPSFATTQERAKQEAKDRCELEATRATAGQGYNLHMKDAVQGLSFSTYKYNAEEHMDFYTEKARAKAECMRGQGYPYGQNETPIGNVKVNFGKVESTATAAIG